MGCAGSKSTPPPGAGASGPASQRSINRTASHNKSRGSGASKSNGKDQNQGKSSNGRNIPTYAPGDIVVKDPLRLGLDDDFSQQVETHPPREFSYEELKDATNNFSDNNLLGEGGFGKVFRGRIRDEDDDSGGGELKDVAVKQLNQEGLQGFNEWLTEVIFLRRLRHPHLVGFVGYCTEEELGLLVYEFMENGSLDYFLFSDDKPPLTWEQRVNVALGAAKGLAYLHEGTGRQVIFRDLKAANILLDKDFNAKLSDFGLAKDGPVGDRTHVSTKVVGTFGYTAPEYMQTGHLTAKSDVYAFGVVLLELLSGRRAIDEDRPWEERNLVNWAKPFLADRRKLGKLMDPRLGKDGFPMKAAQKLIVAAHCCLLDVKSRPSMVDMVHTLTAVKEMTMVSQGSQAGQVGKGGGSEALQDGSGSGVATTGAEEAGGGSTAGSATGSGPMASTGAADDFAATAGASTGGIGTSRFAAGGSREADEEGSRDFAGDNVGSTGG